MTFPVLDGTAYPPRFWALAGYPDSGKSTFATRMRGPLLVVDADMRFGEVAKLADKVYRISDKPLENTHPYWIAAQLDHYA